MRQQLIRTRLYGSELLIIILCLIFQIVKKPGVVIKPIQYEETNPHENPDELRRVIQRVKPNPNIKKTSAKKAKGITSYRRN